MENNCHNPDLVMTFPFVKKIWINLVVWLDKPPTCIKIAWKFIKQNIYYMKY